MTLRGEQVIVAPTWNRSQIQWMRRTSQFTPNTPKVSRVSSPGYINRYPLFAVGHAWTTGFISVSGGKSDNLIEKCIGRLPCCTRLTVPCSQQPNYQHTHHSQKSSPFSMRGHLTSRSDFPHLLAFPPILVFSPPPPPPPSAPAHTLTDGCSDVPNTYLASYLHSCYKRRRGGGGVDVCHSVGQGSCLGGDVVAWGPGNIISLAQ